MEIWISILTASIGIVTVLVGVVTIIFGYNILSYKKKLNSIIRSHEKKSDDMFSSLKSDVDKRLDKSMNDVIKAILIHNSISSFIEKDIKSELIKHHDGLMDIATSLEKASNVSNPYLSAYILNELLKIFYIASKDRNIIEPKIGVVLDYRRLILEGIDANISVIENSGIHGLIEKVDNTGKYIVKEYAINFLDAILKG